jgi:hypothetical protein
MGSSPSPRQCTLEPEGPGAFRTLISSKWQGEHAVPFWSRSARLQTAKERIWFGWMGQASSWGTSGCSMETAAALSAPPMGSSRSEEGCASSSIIEWQTKPVHRYNQEMRYLGCLALQAFNHHKTNVQRWCLRTNLLRVDLDPSSLRRHFSGVLLLFEQRFLLDTTFAISRPMAWISTPQARIQQGSTEMGF